MTRVCQARNDESVSCHPELDSGSQKECHPELDSGSRNIFLASDDGPLSTTRLIELIAKNLDKKVYLVKIPLFKTLLKLIKPSFHKRLYGSLEVDNAITKDVLLGEALVLGTLCEKASLPYSVEDGIEVMIKGE